MMTIDERGKGRLRTWLHGLFNRPRCDMDVCENPKHSRVHIQSGTSRAYVPMNLLVASVLKRVRHNGEMTSMGTANQRVEEIRERRAKIVDAPWWANIHAQVFAYDNQDGKGYPVAECEHDDVACFIANSPADIDCLLAEIKRLTREAESNGR